MKKSGVLALTIAFLILISCVYPKQQDSTPIPPVPPPVPQASETQPPVLEVSPPKVPEQPTIDSQVPDIEASPIPMCKDADCIFKAANDCKDTQAILAQSGADFKFQSSGCVLNKTLVRLDAGPQDLKTALEGKSMLCKYKKGEFDSRWVDTLMFGLEYCEGELKDKLAWLMMVG